MFTISREGEFTCSLIPGTPHCGIKEPNNKFKYMVACTVEDESLDEEGFILDNALLQKYWDEAYTKATPTGLSCERMAHKAAQHFYKLIREKGILKQCVQISVKIWGLPTAAVSFTWVRPDWGRKVGMLATV